MEPKHRELIYLLFVIIFCSIILFYSTNLLFLSSSSFNQPGDHHIYLYMAQHPLEPVDPPFAYRVLYPWIAYLLPFNIELSFLLLAIFCTIMTGFFLYLFLRVYFPVAIGLIGVILYYSLEYAARFQLYDFWLPDSMLFMLTAMAFWAIATERYNLYILVITVGVLCKESILLTFLVYFLSIGNTDTTGIQRYINRAAIKTMVCSISPALLVYIISRLVIPINSTTTYDPIYLLSTIGLNRILTLGDYWYRYLITSWGLLLLVLPLFNSVVDLLAAVRKYLPYVIGVYLQLFVASNNERLIVLAFVPVIFISVAGIDHVIKDLQGQLMMVVVSIIYFLVRTLLGVPFDTSDPFLPQAVFVVFVFVIIYLYRTKHGHGASVFS